MEVTLVGEGDLDIAVGTRLLGEAGLSVGQAHVTRGDGTLKQRLPGYAAASQHRPFVALLDLDQWSGCVGNFVATHLPSRPPSLLLRCPVRSIEAWLMADRAGLARAVGLRAGDLPRRPEGVDFPKRLLLDAIARRRPAERGRLIARLPPLRQGPEYNRRLGSFVAEQWNPTAPDVLSASPSLHRAMLRFRELAERLKG